MFGLFGKKSEGAPVEPKAHWDAKRRVLTLVDSKGKLTEKKNPSAMFAGTHEVARMEMGKDKVSFTLHPKVKHEMPRLVSFDLCGNLTGSRVL
ncbi:hypothetical protein [Lacimonas salitolerans]|uniref:Uncharacterized protein n=1 Tax=Lacimonas salitolerans TaxID=1323750 RepID=A0ABW4EHX6_9RHOB